VEANMDQQVEAMFQAQEQQIAALTQRVADPEQRADHTRDMVERLADHSGFSHPGFGDGH